MPGHSESKGQPELPDVRPQVFTKAERKQRERVALQVSVGFLCFHCHERIDRDDETNYRQVISWVHGPKLQSPVLREQTGPMSHEACIKKILAGQAPDQEDLGLENE